jgi:hypothetical protein
MELPRQMLAIRQAGDDYVNIYGDEFLLQRPMLEALQRPADDCVLLIDEIDRSDHEFEAFLLEFLSDFTISIPEPAPSGRPEPPVVILTSNRTRDLHEALRRRCVYHWIDYPDLQLEAQIVMMRASLGRRGDSPRPGRQRGRKLRTNPWRNRRASRKRWNGPRPQRCWHQQGATWPEAFRRSIGVALKDHDDLTYLNARLDGLHAAGGRMILPQAARPFVEFPAILRAHGFPAAPEQTIGFIEAVGLLGPRMLDIRRAAVAHASVPKEREAEFDVLFRAYFMGQAFAAPIEDADDEEGVQAYEPTGAVTEVEEALEPDEKARRRGRRGDGTS